MDQGKATGSPAAEKVTPAPIAEWLSALRGGKYPQTQGFLRDENGFCCLGVLCDISGVGQWAPSEGVCSRYIMGSRENKSVLPYPLREKYGLPDALLSAVMEMNDSGKPFSVIADYIEQKVIGGF